jgi:hypothetical protein
MSEAGPKSAFELAMERLRRRDEEEGVVQQPVTDAQKRAIAEARNLCEARIAELEVMHQSAMMRTFDPAARAELETAYRRDRDRFVSERDEKIARIRAGTLDPDG